MGEMQQGEKGDGFQGSKGKKDKRANDRRQRGGCSGARRISALSRQGGRRRALGGGRRVNKTQTPSFSAQRPLSPLDSLLHHRLHQSHHLPRHLQSPTTPLPASRFSPNTPGSHQPHLTTNALHFLYHFLPQTNHCSCFAAPPVLLPPHSTEELTCLLSSPSPSWITTPHHVNTRPRSARHHQPKGSLLLHTPQDPGSLLLELAQLAARRTFLLAHWT
ncbi:hypothetical protein QBC39DRAFT_84230 [Podospora conica]|nr:hypothetical protein QBC39DRAFT_84230 [Schizothecium conicum]